MRKKFEAKRLAVTLMARAPFPAIQAEGTPAERMACESLASLQAGGVSVGAGIAGISSQMSTLCVRPAAD